MKDQPSVCLPLDLGTSSGEPTHLVFDRTTCPFELIQDFVADVSDTPISLGMAVVQAIPVLTGTNVTGENGFDFTIYTGDLVACAISISISNHLHFDRSLPNWCLL